MRALHYKLSTLCFSSFKNFLLFLRSISNVKNTTQVGKNYLSPDWKQQLIPFSEFLERIQSGDCSSASMTYLAQHQLFDQACILL